MPSAPKELQDKFPGMDSQAMEFLESHRFKCDKLFCWHPPTTEHKLTQEENDAINYLILEWDYGYEHEVLK